MRSALLQPFFGLSLFPFLIRASSSDLFLVTLQSRLYNLLLRLFLIAVMAEKELPLLEVFSFHFFPVHISSFLAVRSVFLSVFLPKTFVCLCLVWRFVFFLSVYLTSRSDSAKRTEE